MLTKTDIKTMTTSTTYQRGVALWKEERVKEFQIEMLEEQVVVSAKVKGKAEEYYTPKIFYDPMEADSEEYLCNCFAFGRYNGICKHCVALGMTLIESRKSKSAKREPTAYELSNKAMLEQINKRTFSGDTNSNMRALLSRHMMKRSTPIIQKDVVGNVKIEPYLFLDHQGAEVEFRIGITQMYILKDVYEFEKHMEDGTHFSYGQKLGFIHTEDVFTKESSPIARFLLRWTTNNAYAPSYGGYGYGYGYSSYSQTKTRRISLSRGELEDFLETTAQIGFVGKLFQTAEQRYQLKQGEPQRFLTIKENNQKIQLSMKIPDYCCCTSYVFFFEKGSVYQIHYKQLGEVADFLIAYEEQHTQPITIGRTDIPLFCRELLPSLESFFTVDQEEFDLARFGVLEAKFEIYLDSPQKDYITFKILSIYDTKQYNVFDPVLNNHKRDLLREMEMRTLVGHYTNAYDDQEKCLVLANDEEKLFELLTTGIVALQDIAQVFISDSMKHMKVAKSPAVTVGVQLSGDLLELQITSGDLSKEQIIEILSQYQKKKKYYRLKSGEFINMEGEGPKALAELQQGLHLTDRQLSQDHITIPKYRALYLDAQFKEWQGIPSHKNSEFRALVRNMKTIEDNDFEIPSELDQTLREYQKRGFLWLKTIKSNGFGGILADDMGLGKTLQVIAFLLSEQKEGVAFRRCLIVCPASLVYNWNSEIERFAPSLPVKMVVGNAQQRTEILANAEKTDILITSYDLLRRDMGSYTNLKFAYQVIDEAQFIKNQKTKIAQAVKSIEAGFRIALTGTPVENRLSELWSIFDYLMSGFLFTYPRFKTELEIPIVSDQREAALTRLQNMIRPFVLRRLKKDVLKDLPDKIEENVFAMPEGEQQMLYDAHVKRLQLLLDKQSEAEFRSSKIQILSELTKLRQLCCDPALLYEDYDGNSAKMQMCMELIQNAINGGHKILLFSQFTTMLSRLADALTREQIGYYMLTGATSKEQRKQMVEDFNRDDTPVFCISLKAGGTGLNLATADIVIHYDPWWNIAVQNQATDRAHRIGQKNVVTVYKLIIKGTIEENIVKLQDKKKELADQILSGEGIDQGRFSKEELMELLGNSPN
ncbi:MAG: DEAD/DEAH box helicase [Lachnospiraceae bacterium]|jgi:superfamily II DNA or RNA helicase|nr:DEAD/DEAH box helicase [Lachnospiraceae bacterium]